MTGTSYWSCNRTFAGKHRTEHGNKNTWCL